MKKKISAIFLLAFFTSATCLGDPGFSGWRKIKEIYTAGTEGGFVIVLDQNIDNSVCQFWDRGYVDPVLDSHKAILTLATSAFMAGKEVQLYTQDCQTIWGNQYTVFDRIQIK